MTDQSKQALISSYCNAYKTWSGAGGHGKAWSNECLVRKYAQTMADNGIEVPSSDYALANGKFNGEGST